jgi:hypothetical protein
MALSDLSKDAKNAALTVREYLEGHFDFFKLTSTETLAKLTAWLVSRFVFLLLGTIALFFGSLGLGFYLGVKLGAYHLGFFIVGGIVALVLLLMLGFRKAMLLTPVMNSVISLIYHSENATGLSTTTSLPSNHHEPAPSHPIPHQEHS